MIAEQYGVRYLRVTKCDLELIRYWRNQPFIRDTMQFKEYITAEMQAAWFEKINNKYNYYFIVEIDNKKIGLINCKDTEPNTKVAEGGIFIWDKTYWGTPIPVFASLTMLQCIFEIFKSGDASIVTVSKENKRALTFNKILGYTLLDNNKDNEFFKLRLTKEDYFKKTVKLKKAAELYCNGKKELKIIATESDLLIDEINTYIRQTKH
ncbi:MAG: GNAT family N-acetyltransferase, partial [Bacteroidia bacterium]